MGKLIKEEIGDVTYIQMFISNPIGFCMGINTKQKFWHHHECGGMMMLGDNGHFRCHRCGEDSVWFNWNFMGPVQQVEADYSSKGFVEKSEAQYSVGNLKECIFRAGQMISEAGLNWQQICFFHLSDKPFSENGVRYFPIRMPNPLSDDTDKRIWRHKCEDGDRPGRMYVGTNGCFRCDKCSAEYPIARWIFQEPQMNGEDNYYMKAIGEDNYYMKAIDECVNIISKSDIDVFSHEDKKSILSTIINSIKE
ncbi:MAG: hypothetical protein IJR13_06770 [Bacteroidales bacterium]|nr:hypothetical protein [Bacteroidales bacterium]